MRLPGPRAFASLALALLLLAAGLGAQAARNFTYTQNPPIGSNFAMGAVVPITFGITNTSTGGQAGERISDIRFRLDAGASLFTGATTAPAGWTRVFFSPTEVAFRATSWANAIPVGATVNFTLMVQIQSGASNINERLRDIRAWFTSTVGGPPFAVNPTGPEKNAGGWVATALEITQFQITDLAGAPINVLIGGNQFRLVMTVCNRSTVAQSPIVSDPSPPTPVQTGTVNETLAGTAGSPLNLASGACGTITFTYNTGVADNGTIEFTARARRSAAVISGLATSTRLAVGRWLASPNPAPLCEYIGRNVTVTVALINAFPFNFTNVTPTLTPAAGAPAAYVSGPVPAAPIATVPPFPPATNVVYTYQMTAGGTTNPFTFSAFARGTANTVGNPVLTTPTAVSAAVTRGSFAVSINPTIVNAESTNVEMTVSVVNNGCAAVQSVAITPPAGWSGATDPYSLVWLTGINAVETWTAAGTTFSAPALASQMPVGFAGDFAVVFGATPPAPGASVFTVRVTDANGQFQDVPLTVTVNAFKSGTLNDARTGLWREDFR